MLHFLLFLSVFPVKPHFLSLTSAINKKDNNIEIYPNPATNKLTLNTYNFQLLPFTFQLYDIQGSLQREGKITNTQAEINVVDLPRGIYVLKIVTDKQIITKKVVLQ